MSPVRVEDLRYHIVHPTPPETGEPDLYTAGKNLLFVRLETEDGLHGWGECYTQADRDTQIAAHLEQLKRHVLGWDATRIKAFTERVKTDCLERKISYNLANTTEPYDRFLAAYLDKRSRIG